MQSTGLDIKKMHVSDAHVPEIIRHTNNDTSSRTLLRMMLTRRRHIGIKQG